MQKIKWDNNFLDTGVWVPRSKDKDTLSGFDIVLFSQVMHYCQVNNTNVYWGSVRELLKQCGKSTGGNWYKLVEKFLVKTKKVELKFEKFYARGEHIEKTFRIVDSFYISHGRMEVNLNEEFFRQNIDSEFYRYTPLEYYKKLSGFAMRLYEILSCKFYDDKDGTKEKQFPISYKKLANKIGVQRSSPSYLIPTISSAIEELSKITLEEGYKFDTTASDNKNVVAFIKCLESGNGNPTLPIQQKQHPSIAKVKKSIPANPEAKTKTQELPLPIKASAKSAPPQQITSKQPERVRLVDEEPKPEPKMQPVKILDQNEQIIPEPTPAPAKLPEPVQPDKAANQQQEKVDLRRKVEARKRAIALINKRREARKQHEQEKDEALKIHLADIVALPQEKQKQPEPEYQETIPEKNYTNAEIKEWLKEHYSDDTIDTTSVVKAPAHDGSYESMAEYFPMLLLHYWNYRISKGEKPTSGWMSSMWRNKRKYTGPHNIMEQVKKGQEAEAWRKKNEELYQKELQENLQAPKKQQQERERSTSGVCNAIRRGVISAEEIQAAITIAMEKTPSNQFEYGEDTRQMWLMQKKILQKRFVALVSRELTALVNCKMNEDYQWSSVCSQDLLVVVDLSGEYESVGGVISQ